MSKHLCFGCYKFTVLYICILCYVHLVAYPRSCKRFSTETEDDEMVLALFVTVPPEDTENGDDAPDAAVLPGDEEEAERHMGWQESDEDPDEVEEIRVDSEEERDKNDEDGEGVEAEGDD